MKYWIYKHNSGKVEVFERDCKRNRERCIYSPVNTAINIWFPWESDNIKEERELYNTSTIRQTSKADLTDEIFLESI